jgi:hypothetical protein
MNNMAPDDDAGGVAKDMRDTRPFWKRVVMLFQGYCMFAEN